MTKQEAIAACGKMIAQMISKFCPLAGGPCTSNCICYQPPYYDCHSVYAKEGDIKSIDDLDVWFIKRNYCSAYILNGHKRGGD